MLNVFIVNINIFLQIFRFFEPRGASLRAKESLTEREREAPWSRASKSVLRVSNWSCSVEIGLDRNSSAYGKPLEWRSCRNLVYHWMRWVFICPASSGQITFYCIFAFMAPVFGFPLSNLEVVYNRVIYTILRLYYLQKHRECVVI